MRHIHLAATVLISVIMMVSCQSQNTSQLLTDQANGVETKVPLTVTAFPSSTVTQVTPNSTVTENSILSFWNDITTGQYLLVQTYESGIPSLNILAIDGHIVKSIAEDGFFWNTSNDGSSILMIQPNLTDAQYVNLSTKRQIDVGLNNKCYDASWSSNSDDIVIECENGSTIDLYLLNPATNDLTKLTDCLEKDLYCGDPSLSPDGQWIAYSRNDISSGPPNPKNGVYVFNVSCIKDGNCISRQIGPIHSESNPTWSQTNSLAVFVEEGIQLYSVQDSSTIPVKRINTHTANVMDIYASPDGKYLAYAPIGNKTIYLLSMSNSTSEILYEGENISIIGWLTIP